MEFYKEIQLKNGENCILRNAKASDAEAFLHYFELAHGETDFLTTYPDESEHNVEETAERLRTTKESKTDIEICSIVCDTMVGSAGFNMIQDRDKTRHRAEFGISIVKEYWGLGIGRALTESCIACAREAGFLQLELEVVADNKNAISLYEACGFVEFGRNPRGFKNRQGNWQELVLMRLELD